MRRTTLQAAGRIALCAALLGGGLLGWGCSPKPAAVDAARLMAADKRPGDWMSTGRTYDEARFSPLNKINADNVGTLGLAWYADLDSNRGQEATPVVVDGVIYVSTAWSMVKAYDGRTGKLIWAYDPAVPKDKSVNACCDAVNRGVAVWKGKVYVGTLDGRLVALDAANGKPVWSVQTTDPSKPYTITGAPRVIKDKVIIGNGGAEFGVRGYVSAYDAATGKQLWRFYTVPGDPAKGPDHQASDPIMAKAAKTWTGKWWTLGGGGTVWDAMAYDPELNLLYIGVGNGSPWNQHYRSPQGGDNWLLSSMVALNPDTGEYVWHYQTTPGETWDYTATQHMILADLTIGGKPRKVIMQAPKNGFFYVLDRKTGELLSAKNFVAINWATGVDMKTGRPIENPDSRYYNTGKTWNANPGPSGAHSWHPMAFSPKTGLVYIPAQEIPFPYTPDNDFKPSSRGFNVGVDFGAGELPQIPEVKAAVKATLKGALIAWDPVNQKEVWRAQYAGPWNGGVLATAGDLVFQGNAAGAFQAFRADTGAKLWSMPVQTGVVAAPMTYTVDGEQYVAVLAGWGGVYALAPGELSFKSGKVPNISRLLVFKLGGKAKLPSAPPEMDIPLDPPPATAAPAVVAQGQALYARFCGVCHGDAAVSGGLVPDLRHSATLADPANFNDILLNGQRKLNGMATFKGALEPAQVDAIRAYLISRANADKLAAAAKPAGQSPQ